MAVLADRDPTRAGKASRYAKFRGRRGWHWWRVEFPDAVFACFRNCPPDRIALPADPDIAFGFLHLGDEIIPASRRLTARAFTQRSQRVFQRSLYLAIAVPRLPEAMHGDVIDGDDRLVGLGNRPQRVAFAEIGDVDIVQCPPLPSRANLESFVNTARKLRFGEPNGNAMLARPIMKDVMKI